MPCLLYLHLNIYSFSKPALYHLQNECLIYYFEFFKISSCSVFRRSKALFDYILFYRAYDYLSKSSAILSMDETNQRRIFKRKYAMEINVGLKIEFRSHREDIEFR